MNIGDTSEAIFTLAALPPTPERALRIAALMRLESKVLAANSAHPKVQERLQTRWDELVRECQH